MLVVEDEPRIASFLTKGLNAAGYTTTVVDDGLQAAALARDSAFDLVLLDVGLPSLDGFGVLRALRERGERLPVILLTARDAVPDRVSGLRGGADDYLIKPFSFDELLARIELRLRLPSGSTTLTAGGLRVDLLTRTATAGGRSVVLTTQECALAEAFLRAPGQVLSRQQLLRLVWGYDYDPGTNIVDVYVGYLRRKLGRDVIATVRGQGWMLGDISQE